MTAKALSQFITGNSNSIAGPSCGDDTNDGHDDAGDDAGDEDDDDFPLIRTDSAFQYTGPSR